MTVVVVGASTDQVAVDHAGFVNEDPTADLQVELAFWNGSHPTAFDTACEGWDFDSMADACDGLISIKEGAGNLHEIFVVPYVLRCAAARVKNAEVVFWVYVCKRNVGIDGITLPFLGDGPAWLDLMHDHLIPALARCGHHRLVASFLESVVGVESVEGFGGIANDDQDLVHDHENSVPPVFSCELSALDG